MQLVQDQVYAVFQRIAGLLHGAALAPEIVATIERFAESVRDPCIVAVVGQVSAGKSTLINTLLEADVALVGMTETTATVTYFRYGHPADPQRPICCHWSNGETEFVGQSFFEQLRGVDAAALELAAKIDYFERLVPSPFLQQITLVDTPGTGSVVAEHRDTLSQFLQLSQNLEARHTQETQEFGIKADAIIYLLGVTARSSDRDLVEAFQQNAQGNTRSYNTIGVLSKVDVSPRILRRREELAASLAASLVNHVNTVIPVAAAAEKALRDLTRADGAALQRLMRALRAIPEPMLAKMLDIEEQYDRPDIEGCPVPVDERRAIRGAMPWSTFAAIGRIVAQSEATPTDVRQQIESLAGVSQLRKRLQRHFATRSAQLRCYKLVYLTAELLNEVRYELQSSHSNIRAREKRLLAFIDASRGDREIVGELRQLVLQQLGGATQRAEATLHEALDLITALRRELEHDAENFAALMLIDDTPSLFSNEEKRELLALFGGGTDDNRQDWADASVDRRFLSERQQKWRSARSDGHRIRARVAQLAEDCYGRLLRNLTPPT